MVKVLLNYRVHFVLLQLSSSLLTIKYRYMRKRLRIYNAVAVLLTVLFVLLCPAVAPATMFKPPDPGDKAPDFTLPSPSYGRYTLSDSWLKERHKVTLISFYSFACQPCIHELKFLQGLKARLEPGALNVVVVIVDPENSRALKKLEEHKINLPVVWDNLKIVSKRYGLNALLPTCYIIDGQGTFIKKYCGNTGATLAEIEKQVRALAGM